MQTEQEPIRYDERAWKPRPTLSGDDYTSAEIYDEERERIWFGDWVCIGRTEELPEPGDYIVRDLAGESIFITRNEDRELHGFAVESYAGFLFVSLAREPRPLMEWMGQGAESVNMFDRFKMDELRVGVRIVYEVEANWKIVVENYNECLHCPQIHPELVQVVPLFRFGEVWDEETRDDGNWMREGATSFTMTGESELPKLPGLQPEDYSMYYGSYEFPNLLLNLHPDCVMYYIGYPNGPSHTTVVSEYLFRPETIADPSQFKPEPVVELWDLISKQDWEVCQRAQTGVRSRAFTTGVYPRQDRFLYDFNERYRKEMGRALLG